MLAWFLIAIAIVSTASQTDMGRGDPLPNSTVYLKIIQAKTIVYNEALNILVENTDPSCKIRHKGESVQALFKKFPFQIYQKPYFCIIHYVEN